MPVLAARSRLGLARASCRRPTATASAPGHCSSRSSTSPATRRAALEAEALATTKRCAMLRATELSPRTFLGQLSPDERDQLLARWPRRHFPAGSVVIERGELGAGVYVVLDRIGRGPGPRTVGGDPAARARRRGRPPGRARACSAGRRPPAPFAPSLTSRRSRWKPTRHWTAAWSCPGCTPPSAASSPNASCARSASCSRRRTGRVIRAPRPRRAADCSRSPWARASPGTHASAVLLVLTGAPVDDLPTPVHDCADGDDLVALAGDVGAEPACRVARVQPVVGPGRARGHGRAAGGRARCPRWCCAPRHRWRWTSEPISRRGSRRPAGPRPAEGSLTIVGWASSDASGRDPGARAARAGAHRPHRRAHRPLRPAGQRLGRAARSLTRHRVGLALGRGARAASPTSACCARSRGSDSRSTPLPGPASAPPSPPCTPAARRRSRSSPRSPRPGGSQCGLSAPGDRCCRSRASAR